MPTLPKPLKTINVTKVMDIQRQGNRLSDRMLEKYVEQKSIPLYKRLQLIITRVEITKNKLRNK